MDSGHPIERNETTLVTALAALSDNNEVLVGTNQGNIVRRQVDSDVKLQTYVQKRERGSTKSAAITGIATSDDEKFFVTGNSDGDFLLWVVDKEEAKLLKFCNSRINGVCVVKKDYFAACDENGYLHVISSKEEPSLSTRAHQTPVRALASCDILSSEHTAYLATAAFESIKIWSVRREGFDLVCQEVRQIVCPSLDIRTVYILPNGTSLLSGSDDNAVRLWDIESGTILKKFEAQSCGINYVTTNKDKLIACFDDCSAVTWSLESGQLLGRIQGHWGKYNVINILPQSDQAISNGFHYTLKRWSMDRSTTRYKHVEPLAIYQHSNEITALAVSRDGNLLITGTRDKMLKLWLTESGECVSEFHLEHIAQAIACSAEGHLCVGLSDGQVCFMEIQKRH
jgi:WD40 repeat protein